MGGVLELRRLRGLALAGALVLGACSSSGTSPMVAAIRDDLARTGAGATPANPARTITRAQVEAMGVALLRVSEERVPETNLMVAFRQTGPQVTYVLRSDRRLVMHGGLVQSTSGFGHNLAPIGVSAGDPVAFPRPLARWPERIARSYTVSDRGPGRAVTVTCRFHRGKAGSIAIVGRRHSVVTVDETCAGGDIRFANRHFVDPASGFIWSSTQWTGPHQGAIRYDVLEPLD
ncbi:MAG: YjbF family lipoprotein [Silicimonas sp.]|nr:YjbF family lipoprotein [Silicimonas sp.]